LKLQVNIFIANEIHNDGIKKLKKYFKIFDLQKSETHLLPNEIYDILKVNPSEYSILIIKTNRKIDKLLLKTFSKKTNVKLICSLSSGIDHIDCSAAQKFGIDIMNVAGANSISAAEFTFGLILNCCKNIVHAHQIMGEYEFNNSKLNNIELCGKSIGIIGIGRVGSKVAKIAKSFNMKIYGNDIKQSVKDKYKFINFLSLSELLKKSDIITVHTPLDKKTKNLINKKNIKLLKKESVIINSARGGIINEDALIKFLKKNKSAIAGIDVFVNEPKFNKEFLKLNNIILTPHLAGKTEESKKRISVAGADKIIKYCKKTLPKFKLID
jgi:D-3-phosphoglycerate dehydrogenase